MKLTGENRSTRGKTCPSATLSTTNPTWIDPGSNPSLRGEKLAANRLSHGTACEQLTLNSKLCHFLQQERIMFSSWTEACRHVPFVRNASFNCKLLAVAFESMLK
jgi:hypothetical protein